MDFCWSGSGIAQSRGIQDSATRSSSHNLDAGPTRRTSRASQRLPPSGCKVAHGEGSKGSLTCPYHFWNYGLDGSLNRVPKSEEFYEFDAADHRQVTTLLCWPDGEDLRGACGQVPRGLCRSNAAVARRSQHWPRQPCGARRRVHARAGPTLLSRTARLSTRPVRSCFEHASLLQFHP